MPQAQLYLSAVAAGAVNLLGNQGRAGEAATCLAFGNVFASVDANLSWLGIEIWLKHGGLGRTRADHRPLFAGWDARRVEAKGIACLEKYPASLDVKEYRTVRPERRFQSASLAVM
jgi:hypothetical protein